MILYYSSTVSLEVRTLVCVTLCHRKTQRRIVSIYYIVVGTA